VEQTKALAGLRKPDSKLPRTRRAAAELRTQGPNGLEIRALLYSKPRVVDRERRVSRVLYRQDRPTHSEYGTTPYDSLRLRAAAYWMRTSTPHLLSPTATGRPPGDPAQNSSPSSTGALCAIRRMPYARARGSQPCTARSEWVTCGVRK
jgi:hypothetical protein